MNTQMEVYDPVKPFYRAKKKQRIINFFENIERVDWRFYESRGFFNIEILCADWFSITEIIQTLPKDFYCHVNPQSTRLEIYTDAD